jgi:hypothetical protein
MKIAFAQFAILTFLCIVPTWTFAIFIFDKAGMKTHLAGIKTCCKRMGRAWRFFCLSHAGDGQPGARGSLFIKQPTHTQHTHTIFSPSEDMKSTKRPSGNWGPIQDKLVGDLLRSNTIDYRNRTGEYLFAVSEEHFPNFITPGTTGRNSAIQRMRNKFTRYEQDLLVRGARGKKKSCGVH